MIRNLLDRCWRRFSRRPAQTFSAELRRAQLAIDSVPMRVTTLERALSQNLSNHPSPVQELH